MLPSTFCTMLHEKFTRLTYLEKLTRCCAKKSLLQVVPCNTDYILMAVTLKEPVRSLYLLTPYFFFFGSCDYLKITNERNQTFGTYCGQQSGQSIRVTGRYAMISFHSDGSARERGYLLRFSQVPYGKYRENVFCFVFAN